VADRRVIIDRSQRYASKSSLPLISTAPAQKASLSAGLNDLSFNAKSPHPGILDNCTALQLQALQRQTPLALPTSCARDGSSTNLHREHRSFVSGSGSLISTWHRWVRAATTGPTASAPNWAPPNKDITEVGGWGGTRRLCNGTSEQQQARGPGGHNRGRPKEEGDEKRRQERPRASATSAATVVSKAVGALATVAAACAHRCVAMAPAATVSVLRSPLRPLPRPSENKSRNS